MDDRTCRECGDVFNDAEQLRRHLRKHSMTTQEYSLKWVYDNTVPLCKCGCGQQTSWNVALKAYAEHVQGHHAWGRQKSDDEKRRIGEKNSIHMKRYMQENPDVASLRGTQLRSTWTPEKEANRVERTKQAYAAMSPEDKQGFSDRTARRWADGEMTEAREKAAQTFRERSAAGEYDFTERNDKLSAVISQKYVDGTWRFTKGRYVSTKTNRECYYRSSWELQLMQELDADPDVLDWESEFTSIPYQLDGATHRYVPDFHVVRVMGHQLVEVKPQELRLVEKNVAKRLAAQAYCEDRGWQYGEWSP
jgi:hypothetical protein